MMTKMDHIIAIRIKTKMKCRIFSFYTITKKILYIFNFTKKLSLIELFIFKEKQFSTLEALSKRDFKIFLVSKKNKFFKKRFIV